MCSAGHWRKKGAERVDANAKVLARRDFELIGEKISEAKLFGICYETYLSGNGAGVGWCYFSN